MPVMDDFAHMRAALGLARRGLGTTWPNPSVGCVIVREGRVVGRGVTAEGGRPHAEVLALAMAGEAARGATVYVTLEPCNHAGRTPPCTEALIAAGVSRVVVALRDENPVARGGIARLRAVGIVVDENVLADEAQDVAAGFLSVLRRDRPMVTLKLASTLDGRIATRAGESQWISGEPARRAAHALRGRHDAVMVGVGTALTDDPDLRCRIEGFRTRPVVRVVTDSHLRLRLVSKLVATASAAPTWVLARPDADPQRRAALESAGVEVLSAQGATIGVDMNAALAALAERGITRLLVEGGAQLAASLLRADLVDGLAWFHAPAVMGADGWPAAQAFGVEHLAHMPRLARRDGIALGQDFLTLLSRERTSDAEPVRR